MQNHGKVYLYWANNEITNFDGSIRFKPVYWKITRHNWYNLKVYHVWFIDDSGQHWYGRNIGDNDILRCKPIKAIPGYY